MSSHESASPLVNTRKPPQLYYHPYGKAWANIIGPHSCYSILYQGLFEEENTKEPHGKHLLDTFLTITTIFHFS